MANPFRDMSVIMQALVAAAVAVVLVLVGVYVPGSPVARERDEVDAAVVKRTKLNQEVTQLQVYKQRYGELKQQMDALSKQLDTLKTIVPEEKETDEFIRLLQGAASASTVQIRRLTSQAIAPKEYHYEMPFEVQVDGPYFNILDFFGRLGRLSRIINVGDLTFDTPENAKGQKYPVRPGTTVSGSFVATTFFTKPADAGAAKPATAGKP
jgi:type IV pilus assembly protein PilO